MLVRTAGSQQHQQSGREKCQFHLPGILTATDCGWKQNLRLLMQDAVSTRKIPAFPPISVPSCWTVKKTSVQACSISTSLTNDQGIFPGAFPGCFVMLHDEGKRNPGQHSDAPPLMTRTEPPPLSCRGSGACFDYFSTPLCKYKIRRAEEIMPDSCRAPSLHGRKTEKSGDRDFPSTNREPRPSCCSPQRNLFHL